MSTLQTTFIQKLGAGTDAFEIPANDGTSGQYLQTDGTGGLSWQTVTDSGFESYAILQDLKNVTSDGGTFTSGAWRTRDLNHEVDDPDGIVTLASNQFTLGAGSYLIRWSAPAYKVQGHQTRLFDATNTTVNALGSQEYTEAADNVVNRSFGADRVTIAGNTTFEIQHRCWTTRTSNGLGVGSSGGAFNDVVFTIVEIFREA